jgi:hypothetical protein
MSDLIFIIVCFISIIPLGFLIALLMLLYDKIKFWLLIKIKGTRTVIKLDDLIGTYMKEVWINDVEYLVSRQHITDEEKQYFRELKLQRILNGK